MSDAVLNERRARRFFRGCYADLRKWLIGSLLTLMAGFATSIMSFDDAGWSEIEWQQVLAADGYGNGNPEHFLYAGLTLKPINGGFDLKGLPDGQTTLQFDKFKWSKSFDGSGDVIMLQSKVVYRFFVKLCAGGFLKVSFVSIDGNSVVREFWFRVSESDRRDDMGRLASECCGEYNNVATNFHVPNKLASVRKSK
jgi:hypothetical protein